jgi:P4 family phage/plasmid primase-like protien
MTCDLSQMQSWWDATRLPNEVVNVRIPTVYTKNGKLCEGAKNVHCASVAEIAAFVRNNSATQYWATVQEVDPSTIAPNAPVSDENIKRFRWGILEIDPERKRPEDPADLDVESLRQGNAKGEVKLRASDPIDFEVPKRGKCMATEAEKRLAFEVARKAYDYVKKNGGVSPVVEDSGNGAYVKIPVDISCTEENANAFAAAIDAFARIFRTPGVDVDTTAKNRSRILGIPGTLNAKGESTDLRPHRMRKLLVSGDRKTVLTLEQFTALAKVTETNRPSPPSAPKDDEPELGHFTYQNVDALLKKLDGRSTTFTHKRGKTKYGPGWWVRCPNDAKHSDAGADLNSSSAVWVATERGFPNFCCLHAHCTDINWQRFVADWNIADLQEVITKPWNQPDPASTVAWLGDAGATAEPSANTSSDTGSSDTSSAADASSIVAAPFFSDIALAKKFARAAKGRIAFLDDRGVWTYYADGRWRDDDRTARHTRHIVSEYLLQQMPKVDEIIPKAGEKKEDAARARARHVLKNQLGSAAKENSVRSQVQHQPGMFLRADQFDKDPFLLGAPGGQAIDLKTGSTRPARPEDYLSKSVVCLPAGDCPQWLGFMEGITGGDADLQSYIQRTLGYWLTADVREQCLGVWHGPGGNGKGTLMSVVQHLLGDSDKSGYACTVPMDALMTKKSGETDLRNVARMCGARLVVSQESGLQRKFDSGLLKTLTGGDELTGEKKFEHPFNFSPTHKLVVVTNHRPKVDLDEGMKRRLHLVPFLQVYDHDKTKKGAKPPDRMLKEKLLAEAQGILAWMIEGCLAWQERGLDPPASVLNYTTEFFADHDTLGEWIEQNCDDVRLTDPKEKASNEDLFADWKMFCSNGRGDPGTHADFVENLQKRGFKRCRINNSKRGTLGLRIKSAPYSTVV